MNYNTTLIQSKRVKKIIEELPEWYGEGREFIRTKVRIRDNFQCQECYELWDEKNFKRHFHVHHLNGECGKKSRGYDKTTIGLVTLCPKCHHNHHSTSENRKKKHLSGAQLIKRNEKVMKLVQKGMKHKDIGEKFGITSAMVGHIKKVMHT